jgi:hypothetical protein
MSDNNSAIVGKVWSFCNTPLRGKIHSRKFYRKDAKAAKNTFTAKTLRRRGYQKNALRALRLCMGRLVLFLAISHPKRPASLSRTYFFFGCSLNPTETPSEG